MAATRKSRADLLAADLLADLEREGERDAQLDAEDTPRPAAAAPASPGIPARAVQAGAPAVETMVRFTPSSWRFPSLHRSAGTLSGRLGPLQIELRIR